MKYKFFNQEQADIIQDILDNYHFNSGIRITGDRYFIYHRPDRLARLHHEFAQLTSVYVFPGKEGDYMQELKRIHKALKREYAKLKKSYQRRMFYERIKSVFGL